MIDEIKRRPDSTDGGDAGRLAALDHHDLDSEVARGLDLGIGHRPARIFRDHHVDAVFLQQAPFVIDVEWSAGQQVAAIGHVEWRIDRIDAAHEIGMLRGAGEAAGLLATDGEEDTPRRRTQHADRGIDVGDAGPSVGGILLPLGTPQRKDRSAGSLGRHRGVGGDAIGKRMRGVNQQVDIFLSQVINQPFDAAEAANAGRQGQGFWVDRPSGKRYRGTEIVALGEGFGQSARFRRAAENENFGIAHA